MPFALLLLAASKGVFIGLGAVAGLSFCGLVLVLILAIGAETQSDEMVDSDDWDESWWE